MPGNFVYTNYSTTDCGKCFPRANKTKSVQRVAWRNLSLDVREKSNEIKCVCDPMVWTSRRLFWNTVTEWANSNTSLTVIRGLATTWYGKTSEIGYHISEQNILTFCFKWIMKITSNTFYTFLIWNFFKLELNNDAKEKKIKESWHKTKRCMAV